MHKHLYSFLSLISNFIKRFIEITIFGNTYTTQIGQRKDIYKQFVKSKPLPVLPTLYDPTTIAVSLYTGNLVLHGAMQEVSRFHNPFLMTISTEISTCRQLCCFLAQLPAEKHVQNILVVGYTFLCPLSVFSNSNKLC